MGYNLYRVSQQEQKIKFELKHVIFKKYLNFNLIIKLTCGNCAWTTHQVNFLHGFAVTRFLLTKFTASTYKYIVNAESNIQLKAWMVVDLLT